MRNSSVKILFRFFNNVLDKYTVETLWAEVINASSGHYKINNIPFYACVASGDIVYAEHEPMEDMLVYRKTVEFSGNSTVQVILLDHKKPIQEVRNIFEELGCISEKLNRLYFAMEIPSDTDYAPVRLKLKELENRNIIDYAEPCLGRNHWYD